MPTPDENEEEVVAEPEVKKEAPAKTTPPAKTTDWEGSYKGLQRQYDKLQTKFEKLQADYEALQEEHEGSKVTAKKGESDLSALNGQLQSKDAEIQRLNALLAQKERGTSRMKLIMAEFSDLAPLEAEGLLPDAETDEQLREKLQKFVDNLENKVGKKVAEKVKGAGPGSTAKKEIPEMDIDQIYNRMARLAGTNDPQEQAEYEQLRAKWDEYYSKS